MGNGIDPLEKGKRIVEKKSDARERETEGVESIPRDSTPRSRSVHGGRIAVPPQGPTTSSPSNWEGDELFYNGNRSKFALPVGGGGGKLGFLFSISTRAAIYSRGGG